MSVTALNLAVTVQRAEALQRANAVRTGRRLLREELHAMGRPQAAARIAELVQTPPVFLSSMLVWELLRGLWGGKALSTRQAGRKAQRLMRACGVDPWATVGGLSERQRLALASRLGLVGVERVR